MNGCDFSGKTVFLTGGARGIGHDIKVLLEELGATVIAPTRSELDLSIPEQIEDYIHRNQTLEVDIFIHCAGMNQLASLHELDQNVFHKTFQVNYFSAVRLSQYFAEHMRKRAFGRIIFISSIYALVSRERRLQYTSSKTAITGLVKTLAIEEGINNILVNAVAPGYVMTEMTLQNLSQEEIQDLTEMIPTRKLQTVRDISNLVAFLASDFNQSITGQLIAVDGGFTCR
ncbi:MAG: SDR family oxidoreductase [Eubacteriales bacterium]